MTVITPTTKLEAVNAVLALIGESPINSLSDEFVDAQIASNYIDQESRRVQLQNWSFNTDYEWTLTPDGNGYLIVPAGAMKVVVEGYPEFVMRVDPGDTQTKLYDRNNNTFVFTESKDVTITWAFEFESLPEALRQWLMIRAGRRFSDQTEGDPPLHTYSQQDELTAWAAFLNFEASVAKYNVIRDSPTVYKVMGKRNR
ncbi:MAG: hypothetical protein ACWGQW_00100 [bacterium]